MGANSRSLIISFLLIAAFVHIFLNETVTSASSNSLLESASDTSDSTILNTDSTRQSKSSFSGLYLPNTQYSAENYAGAWLTTRAKFLASISHFRAIRTLEDATFSLLRHGLSLMSRDFFDFQVLHLSSTTNQLPSLNNLKLNDEIIFRMKESIKDIAFSSTSEPYLYRDKRIVRSTVAIIPFSTNHASLNVEEGKKSDFLNSLRLLYLQTTFYSVNRYFSKVVVVVASSYDMDLVRSLGLNFWKFVDVSSKIEGNSRHLPKHTLLYLYEMLSGTAQLSVDEQEEWRSVRYVYYTESDHTLYARHLSAIYNVIDRFNGTLTISPHRMQTIGLPKTFKNEHLWKNHYLWPDNKLAKLKNVDLVVEDPIVAKGSCCDAGRYKFGDCGNWWYNCPYYGLHNYTTWIRFGQHGFTLPLGTEHQARCSYSSKKELCPLPSDCNKRIPKFKEDICDELRAVDFVPAL